jgi:aldehyde dehydrogenase (NAD+)
MLSAINSKEAPTAVPPDLIAHLETMKTRFPGMENSLETRLNKLSRLKKLILRNETAIYDALYSDLHKSREESWVTELGLVIAEINSAMKHLKSWMRPKRVGTNLVNLPSSSYIHHEPLGVVLIIGPWNYPFQLLMGPLVGAIAAGNKVVLKPSEFAPVTASLMNKMITQEFDPADILFVEGEGSTVVPEMMNHFSFDHVFFTGGTAVGKIIYEMAASRLVPVTLELGGKSPCIVESDANIKVAARRIAVTKFSNAGQMCIAPDYLLVHHSVKDKLVEELKNCITRFYTTDPQRSESYGRIINERQFNRLTNYLSQGRILAGGRIAASDNYISPTLIDEISMDASIMKEEIFGPILPVISYGSMEEAIQIIARNPNPLSLYVYTSSKETENKWIHSVPFGGGCINNSSWHFTNPHLPFGGRGKSGTGAAHGKYTFECFSHRKSILRTPAWFDPDLKYPPFKGKLSLFKKIIR